MSDTTRSDSFIAKLVRKPAIIEMAHFMLANGFDYSAEFNWMITCGYELDGGYSMYDMGDAGVCIVHDNGDACMNKARIIARVI